jgi:stearoyl-CoA desaturase (delta-9 desaturase)
VAGALRGLWHAHAGWLWSTHGQARAHKYATELVEDKGMRVINRRFPLIVLASLLLPGGPRRAALLQPQGRRHRPAVGRLRAHQLPDHVTWSVNSVGHFFGKRRFAVEDHSTNVFWLAIPSFGESWHHNHHAFPRSAAHGLRCYEIDPSAMLIQLMRRVGLAWNVVQITPPRQTQKLMGYTKPSTPEQAEREPTNVPEPV